MRNWKTKLTLIHESGTLTSHNINITRGIFQGESLSPLLFLISLISISLKLNSSDYGYKIGTTEITHLFCIDDLKLCAKDDIELEGLLRIVKGYSDDIGIEFELSKCAKPAFKRGKLQKSDHVRLDGETMIKDLEQQKVYKYLGVDESIGIQHVIMKRKLKKELVKRTRVIRKSISVITYSFNIIGWNLSEVKRLDIKIRNMTKPQSMHHPKADIHRLYLRISNGGRGLTQLELFYETSRIGLFRYLNLLDGNVLQLALNHEKKKRFTLCCKRS